VEQKNAAYNILVTAGPTVEPIDPVRFISNHSTGTMGYAIASEAAKRGHKVTLISGPTCLEAPDGVELVRVTTASQMRDKVLAMADKAECLIMSAAVCDFRPEKTSGEKIKKGGELTVKLVKNPDILKELVGKKDMIKIGFALETRNTLDNASMKLKDKGLDLVVANEKSPENDPFGGGEKNVTIIDKKGNTKTLEGITKNDCAARILDEAESLIHNKKRATGEKGFTLGELLVVFALVMGVILLLHPIARKIHERSDRVICANNIREIGKASYIYAKEHARKFPDTLKTLYDEKYLADAGLADCPATRHKGTPDDPDYVFSDGLSVTDPSEKILVQDKTGNHQGGRNVLFVNGVVSWEKE